MTSVLIAMGLGVHEVEALTLDPRRRVREATWTGERPPSPCAARSEPGCIDGAGPLTAISCFSRRARWRSKGYDWSTQMPSTGRPPRFVFDHPLAGGSSGAPSCTPRPLDAGDQQSVGRLCRLQVGREGPRSTPARSKKKTAERQFARPVVEDNHGGLGHYRRPSWTGYPSRAVRSRRRRPVTGANALNCVSTMWCGSATARRRACSARCAWKENLVEVKKKRAQVGHARGAAAEGDEYCLALGLPGVHAVGTAGHVDHGLHERLLERHRSRRRSHRKPALSAKSITERLGRARYGG